MVGVLALLSHSGRVVCAAVTLAGLQWVVIALQVNMARGQGHLICPVYLPVALRHLGVGFVRAETFVVLCWGGQVDHLDVWDTGLPQDQL